MNLSYISVMIPYWAGCAVIRGFSTLLLLERGFSSTQIGIILGICFAMAAIAQPLVAAKMDSTEKLTLPGLTAILAVMSVFFVLCLIILPVIKPATVILIILIYMMIYILFPVTNSLAGYYMNKGYKMNFGLARGLGSLAYAGTSTLSGIIMDRWPGNTILFFLVAVWIIMIGTTCLMIHREGRENKNPGRRNLQGERKNVADKKEKEKALSLPEFAREHKRFMLLLLGTMLFCIFHNMIETYMYMIMESLGGDASDTGLALSIAAALELIPLFLITALLTKFSTRTLMITASIGFSLKALMILFAGSVGMVWFSMAFQIFAYGLQTASSVYYINELIPPKDQVKGQSLMTAAFTAGGVLGSLIGGLLIGYLGIHYLLLVGSVISVAGTVIAVLNTEDTRKVHGSKYQI